MGKQLLVSAVIALIVAAWLFPISAPQIEPTTAGAPTGAPASAPPAREAPKRCSPADFEVQAFKPSVVDECRRTPCPSLKLIGKLRNNCSLPAGAQVQITAYDKAGQIVDTTNAWPASTRNIAPGDADPFDMGPLLRYQPNMARFSIRVIDATTW